MTGGFFGYVCTELGKGMGQVRKIKSGYSFHFIQSQCCGRILSVRAREPAFFENRYTCGSYRPISTH